MSISTIKNKLKSLNIVVIVPTYNNAETLAMVLESILEFAGDVIVVNDGSTDKTEEILNGFRSQLQVISYPVNRGKGYALKQGFRLAVKNGFRYAVSIDSDGQHFASDIVRFAEEIEKYPDSLIMGSRLLKQENMAEGSTFANKFSNFWFRLQTRIPLPDTQSGYRLYPLNKMGRMSIISTRYEAELEILVFSAWRGIDMRSIPIKVYYAPAEEKISHFRPFHDFFRISILNTILTFLAFIYGYPSMLIRKLLKR